MYMCTTYMLHLDIRLPQRSNVCWTTPTEYILVQYNIICKVEKQNGWETNLKWSKKEKKNEKHYNIMYSRE